MADTQGWSHQLEWCGITLNRLQGLQEDVLMMSLLYTETMEQLKSSQFIDEDFRIRLVPVCNDFIESANSLVNHLQNVHIDYIENQQNVVRGLLDSA